MLATDLNSISYREYEVPFDVGCLMSVSLAIRPLLFGSPGTAGIEIVSAEGDILAQTVQLLEAIAPGQVTEFRLPVPLMNLQKTWLLRVFVRGADAPVPIYELAQAALFRSVTKWFPLVSFQVGK
jgi:hypothetical protein